MIGEDNRVMEWLSIALDLLDQVDESRQTTEWRDDRERLRVRFYNKAHADGQR